MNGLRSKINNSYESSDSGGSASSSETRRRRSSSYDAMEKGTSSLGNLLMPSLMTDFELYNTSAEEGIFPNVNHIHPIVAPSYQPEYDYNNEYSTTPLVYNWMPIVPGFAPDGTDNLENFEHIIERLNPHPLNISSVKEESTVMIDQKQTDYMALNSSANYHFQRLELLDASKEVTSFSHQLEDSCNAMDLNISCHAAASVAANETSNLNIDLSFNGKISEMNSTTIINDPIKTANEKQEEFLERFKSIENDQEDEEEKIRNESFEMLKNEDSSKMILVNEKSPEVVKMEDEESEEQQVVAAQVGNQSAEFELIKEELEEKKISENMSLNECDAFIAKRLHLSVSSQCAPPSITTLPLSLTEMLMAYKQNVGKEPISKIKSRCLFAPSHPLSEVLSMEYPQLVEVRAHGIMYNRNDDCEDIESMRLRFTDKYIRAETTTSFTHKNGPTSAKKKVDKLRFLTQSPGSRLSHLANRRKIFSSANLKTSAAAAAAAANNASQKLNGFLVDPTKLFQRKRRYSAKKNTPGKRKTPGKKKTPKSAKRQQQLQIARPEPTISSSKRALFTSPSAGSSKLTKQLSSSSLSSFRSVLPTRRTLFSPVQNTKRKRSPSPDAENRFGKTRRLDSPSKQQNQSLLMKSRSFSIAAPATSSGSLDEHYKKTLFYRTQSEMALNQSSSLSSSTLDARANKSNLGLRKPLSDVDKKKLLWTASSALQSKQINREHEKFKEFMSILCRLVKKVLSEFYHPQKSMSAQMQKFSNMMVFYVIQGRSFDDIYATTKARLDAQNPTKVSGYIAPDEYEKNCYIRKNSSLLLLTGSCSSLNYSSNNSDSLLDATFNKSGSDTSLSRSTSKSNADNVVLRENFQGGNRENSTRKLYGGSDSNLNKLAVNSSTSTNIMKAKRQISF